MELNADLVGRHLLRMAEITEGLIAQRDALAQENDTLRKAIEQAKGLRAVPSTEKEADGA